MQNKRATISDVARAADVSKTTVSYVLSGRADVRVPQTTRQRILRAAESVGYQRNALAVALRSGRLNTVGIAAPFSLASVHEASSGVYLKDLLLALTAASFAAGMNAILMPADVSPEFSLGDIADRRADGVIVVVMVRQTTSETVQWQDRMDAFVQSAEESGVPCVTIGGQTGTWRVLTDSYAGGRAAMTHLLGLGHRRIAYLWYGYEAVVSAARRREAFRDAAREAQIAPGDQWEITNENAQAIVDLLQSAHRPTAVFCFNDALAVWLLDRAREAGLRVPEDLSIVGFDDNILATTARPELTTVRNPIDQLALEAVDLMKRRLAHEPAPSEPILIAPWLVERQSTAPRDR